MNDFDDHERFILDQIARIRMDYQAKIEPWLKRLTEIHAARPQKPIVWPSMDFPGVDIDAVHRSKE